MRSRSLRSRLAILFAIAGTLILLLTAAGSVAYARLLRDRSALVDRIEPAQQHLESLFTAYVNQETGVRGYVLTGDPSFLQPYDQGGKDAVDQSSVLRDTLRDDVQLNRDLEGVDRAAVAWRQQFAQPAIDATREGQRTFASEAELSTSKVLFDDVRGAVDEARDHLRAAVDRAKDRLSTSSDQLAAVLAAAVVVLLATGFLLWRALREWVVEPVAAVAADARAVTAGELVHQVRPVGPPEIEQLARDIEAMRRRIVDDLAAVEAANLAVESANDDLSRSNAGARAVRLCRVARPPGAVAQGGELLPAHRAAVRRPARRARSAVHRLRGRRREAHADLDQRPARVLAGRTDDRTLRAGAARTVRRSSRCGTSLRRSMTAVRPSRSQTRCPR